MSKRYYFIFLLLFGLLLISCSRISTDTASSEVNTISLTIPGLTQTYKLVYLSDLHIIDDIMQVDEEHRGTVQSRKTSMVNEAGITARDYWPELVEQINDLSPDIVLLGGDMIDYMSPSNVSCLNEGLSKVTAPVMYVRADHDYANWYDKDLSGETIDTLGKSIDENNEIMIYPLEEITILGINKSTSQISATALDELHSFFDTNEKPVILLTHVPFSSAMDTQLDIKSKEVWQNRSLIWGKNCYYVPDGNTKQAMESIFNSKNRVKAVLAGHLHFPHIGKLTETTTQYIFGPAYSEKITVITVSGQKN